jgi:hypothetical protein
MPVSVYYADQMCASAISGGIYLALLTSYPSSNDTGSTLVEPTQDYERYYLDPAYWGDPVNGTSTWNFDVTILPLADYGTIIAYALCASLTSGQVLAFEYFSTGMYVSSGSRVLIPSGSLTFTVQ